MRLLYFTFIFSVCFGGFAQNTEDEKIEQALSAIKDLTFRKVSPPSEKYPSYRLKIKQAIDHSAPQKGYFFQYVILTHHGFNQPTVMQTQGYDLYFGQNEIENLLDANHINIEHRYFGLSKPDSIDFGYLNLEQATADLHVINQIFKSIYKGKWISTGISKGGVTTIFYKYFYPYDVDISIPYVAPLTEGLEDKRIYQFLDTIGTDECRKKIVAFQKFMLKNETTILDKLKWYSKGANLTFNYLDQSMAKAYELSILEYSFSFWQWGNACSEIPSSTVTLDSALNHLLKVSNLDFFSDKLINQFSAHYYQAATELGYYGYNITPFKNELQQFKSNPLAIFAPKSAGIPKYDNTLQTKVNQWLYEKGNNIIYIYGGSDTWTANRVIPSSKVNSKSFILPGKDHGGARVKNMDKNMQKQFSDLVKSWTGLIATVDGL